MHVHAIDLTRQFHAHGLVFDSFRFFSHAKYPSFQRQLNLYGFSRFNYGQDKGAYYHLGFVRGHRHLVRSMKRVKIKGGQARKTTEEEEPNFYDAVWKNHSEASYPTPSLRQPLSGMRVVTPRGEAKALVLNRVPRVPIVNHIPTTIHSSCMHAGNVSDDNSDDSSSWEASVFDHLPCEEECLPVIIPPSVLQNCAIYDNPFEPTPIREPWMTTTVTVQSCSPFFGEEVRPSISNDGLEFLCGSFFK